MFFSPPFCTGYAYHSYRRADPKWAALAGLVLSTIELLLLIIMIGYGLLDAATR